MTGLTGINKVTWNQVGRVTKPDRYQFSYGWLTIAPEDLVIWRDYPNAIFTLVERAGKASAPGQEYRLGTFELR